MIKHLALGLLLTVAAGSAMAASYGSSWSTGTATTQGHSRGASTTQFNSSAVVGAITPNSISGQSKLVSETTVTASRGAFGSTTSYTTNGLDAGALAMNSRSESGSGWSSSRLRYNVNGTEATTGTELSWGGNFGQGGLAISSTNELTSYSASGKVRTTEEHDFGSYVVTIGAK